MHLATHPRFAQFLQSDFPRRGVNIVAFGFGDLDTVHPQRSVAFRLESASARLGAVGLVVPDFPQFPGLRLVGGYFRHFLCSDCAKGRACPRPECVRFLVG